MIRYCKYISNVFKDWMFFLATILVVKTMLYSTLVLFFSFTLNYNDLIVNLIFTFLIYIICANIFELYEKLVFGNQNQWFWFWSTTKIKIICQKKQFKSKSRSKWFSLKIKSIFQKHFFLSSPFFRVVCIVRPPAPNLKNGFENNKKSMI